MSAVSKPRIQNLTVCPSPVARRLLWHLFRVGRGKFREERRFGPAEKPGAGFLAIESGSGALRLESGTYALRPGPVFWLYSMQQHRAFVPTPGKTLITRAIVFSGPGLEAWLEELEVARQPEFRVPHPAIYHNAHRKLERLVKTKPRDWEWQVHDTLNGLLREFLMTRNLLATDHVSLPETITRVLEAVAAEPLRDWRPRELAVLTGVSYSAFRTLFREAMHESPHVYLQRTRLDTARQMLSNPRHRIKEIAHQLHFCSEHYFSTFFRKSTGVTPTEFRRHLGLADEI